MRKTFLSLLAAMCIVLTAVAQTRPAGVPTKDADSLKVQLMTGLVQKVTPCYKVFYTGSGASYLELETFSGKVWLINYTLLKKSGSGWSKSLLNDTDLASGAEQYPGRFEMVHHDSTSFFLLLDSATGSVYEVNWTAGTQRRGVMPIL